MCVRHMSSSILYPLQTCLSWMAHSVSGVDARVNEDGGKEKGLLREQSDDEPCYTLLTQIIRPVRLVAFHILAAPSVHSGSATVGPKNSGSYAK